MISSSVTLVVLLDTGAAIRWREPLLRAAREAQRPVTDGPAPGAIGDLAEGTIIISDDVNWLVLIPPKQAALLWTGQLPSAGQGRMSPYDKAVWLVASGRLSVACHVLGLGAVLHDANSDVIALSGLEIVQTASPSRSEIVRDSPLAIYQSLPPAVGATAVWPGTAFWYPVGDQSDGGEMDIDLTGRNRVVIHGPYLHLPPGSWRITAEFHVDPERGMADLRMQWGTEGDFTDAYFVFSEPGVYAAEIEHEWLQSGPAQLVVWVDKPLFQGRLRLDSAKVAKIAQPPPK